MKHPKLVTFCSNEITLQSALNCGIDHLILEDPKLSLRSYEPHYYPNFDHLLTLANTAKQIRPDIELSFNLDIMVHHDHFPLIEKLISTLKNSPITQVRIQDPGLVLWLKSALPSIKVHLDLGIGNSSALGIQSYATLFDSQSLTNELPISDLKIIRKTIDCPLEIQVFGPILIQYSNRRYLAHAENTEKDLIRYAHDNEYPGRIYRFYDNPHGHLMYLYFDRCLLQDLPKLYDLEIDAWLFDGRGEAPEYLETAVKIFKAALERLEQNPQSWTLSEEHWTKLQSIAKRPLKPGFFRANLTDQDRQNAWESVRKNAHLATILDMEKGQFFAIEIHRPFEKNTQATIITPKGKKLPLSLSTFFDLSGTPLETPPESGLVLIPWQKGISAQSRIYNLNTKC